MRYFLFKDYIIGASDEEDNSMLLAVQAYYCLIGDVEETPEEIDEPVGYRLALASGYSDSEIYDISLNKSGNEIVLIQL